MYMYVYTVRFEQLLSNSQDGSGQKLRNPTYVHAFPGDAFATIFSELGSFSASWLRLAKDTAGQTQDR